MIDPLSFATGLAAGLSVSLAIVMLVDWWLSRLARFDARPRSGGRLRARSCELVDPHAHDRVTPDGKNGFR